jgi:hypothetical protein
MLVIIGLNTEFILDHGPPVRGSEIRSCNLSDLLSIEWSFLVTQVQGVPTHQRIL